tara:strand:+ start:408 stop:1016 length:609 start_codon:yes stop_codon:yes gene_type:complete
MKSLYYELGSHYLNLKDFEDIQKTLELFPLEDITIGDAGEINNCKVGRLVEDHPETFPTRVNKEYSKRVLDIIFNDQCKAFLKNIIPEFKNKELCVRRCQFNLLTKGSFVGKHLDIDSNPDYRAAVVFQLGSKFTGGHFDVYKDMKSKKPIQEINPSYASICISDSRSPHAVREVTSGVRTSLVMFVSSYSGKNKRKKLTGF